MTATITFRCTPRQKAGYLRRARDLGFDSLAGWVKDRLQSEGEMNLRLRRLLCGMLGQIGARMIALAESELPADVQTEAHALAGEITRMQDILISGRIDDPEGH